MKSESAVSGSSDSETRPVMVAVLGMMRKVQDCEALLATCSQRPLAAYTNLLVLKLDKVPLVLDHLIPFVHARLEQLGQREPLPSHLVPVIRVHELVVVDAVGRVALHPLDCRLAAVERDDVVNERLPVFLERQRLGGVGGVVFACGCLARLEVLAGYGGHDCYLALVRGV